MGPTGFHPPNVSANEVAATMFHSQVPDSGSDERPGRAETLDEKSRPLHVSSSEARLARVVSAPSYNTGYPTVIRHPARRVRPSFHTGPDPALALQVESSPEKLPQHSTEPSSFQNSRSASTGDISTAKTSPALSFAPRAGSLRSRTEKRVTPAESVIEGGRPEMAALLSAISSHSAVQPTIRTVETTANAKIFFETHFNCLLSRTPQPRAVRKQALEEQLALGAFTADQRREERRRWLRHESDYLRRSRALKVKSLSMLTSGKVSVADYEIIRVLGKGSFGVVRLVREKPEGSSLSPAVSYRRPPTVSKSMSSLVSSIDRRAVSPRLMAKESNTELFAMKVIRKSEMLRNSQEGHLRAERDFLVASEKSKWIVPLIASFQDRANLYLVMEYMIGGDFLSLLIRRDRLEEKRAQFYIAEMILCLEEAHRLKWIHRDVKPDNFLISASGHLKISDFGLAFDGHWSHDQGYFKYHRYSLLEKLGIRVAGDLFDKTESIKAATGPLKSDPYDTAKWARGRHHVRLKATASDDQKILQWRNRRGRRNFAKSVVGTSQYMAPEVIRGHEYDGRCDWWSVGIILFEVS